MLPAANRHQTPRSHYLIDPKTVLIAHEEARAAGLEIVGYYHSHPDGPAVPSRKDLEDAWPDTSYLIVAVGSGGVEARSWRLDERGGAFVEERVESLDGR